VYPLIAVAVLGAINWDINLFVKRFPEVGEEVAVEKIQGFQAEKPRI